MRTDREKIAALRRIVDAAWQVEQSRTARIASEEAALRNRIDALSACRQDRLQDLTRGPDAARLAGADPLWESWIDGRRSDLLTELARLLAQKDRAQRRLARAFGRREAATGIAHGNAPQSGRPDQP
ncbi:hypothetical protein [Histidinibacterium lentulum]|uniref:Flagellar protein FlgN n=1 Tax=Histidinibacterium lentulum TaxID=2480588 RepID=A0A3N2R780_9RHOB|nr:hypothetical protein [Histidinibacterium lentulum]ROU03243.1 hypothetical protein EAT49_08120 [Histidinibacterium lentulum]